MKDFRPWKDPVLDIGYSTVGLAPINTRETFISVAKCGFNAAKADLRITKDGVLVLCHDAWFALDEDGRIAARRTGRERQIREMTADEVFALEHAAFRDELGYGARPASLEEMLAICMEYSLTPVITLRDEYLDEIIPELLRILRKYSLTERVMINSMTYASLTALHAAEPRLCMSYTLSAREILTPKRVREAAALERAVLTMFSEPFPEGPTVLEKSAEGIDLARSMEIPLFMAQVGSAGVRRERIAEGFSGFHITKPILPGTFAVYPFRVRRNGSGFELSDRTAADRFTAAAQPCAEGFSVSDIAWRGSRSGIPDAVVNTWFFRLPHRVSAADAAGNPLPARTEGRRIIVACGAAEGPFDVTLEI